MPFRPVQRCVPPVPCPSKPRHVAYVQHGTNALQHVFRDHFSQSAAEYDSRYAKELGNFRLERAVFSLFLSRHSRSHERRGPADAELARRARFTAFATHADMIASCPPRIPKHLLARRRRDIVGCNCIPPSTVRQTACFGGVRR